ncbi:hypothetical protein gvb04_03525 [Gardnerella vaginalis]|nr:hypothetical protein gvb04_03525 [Gardnerella vaginalis]
MINALCTKFDLKHVQKAEHHSALCTKFDLKHVQKAEHHSALCTKFDLKHVQKAERLVGKIKATSHKNMQLVAKAPLELNITPT